MGGAKEIGTAGEVEDSRGGCCPRKSPPTVITTKTNYRNTKGHARPTLSALTRFPQHRHKGFRPTTPLPIIPQDIEIRLANPQSNLTPDGFIQPLRRLAQKRFQLHRILTINANFKITTCECG